MEEHTHEEGSKTCASCGSNDACTCEGGEKENMCNCGQGCACKPKETQGDESSQSESATESPDSGDAEGE